MSERALIMVRIVLLVCCAAALISASANSAKAQTRVVATVNDIPITSYDVNNRAKFLSVTGGKPNNAANKAAALDELIEEALKFQEARRLGISATKEQVDQSFAQIASRLKLTPSKLVTAFRQVGVDADTLRSRIEADIVWGGVVRQRFRQEVQVRETDVLRAIGGGSEPVAAVTTKFNLQKIIVILPKDAGDAVLARRTQVAESFRQQFQGCAGTHALTQQFDGVVWDKFGSHVLAKFDSEDQERLSETGVNQVTRPRRTPNALEMFAVCGREEIEDDTQARRQAEREIQEERGTVLARRLLIDLKQSAVIVRR